MRKLAYVFPGQGSQKVGMGEAIAGAYGTAQNVFSQADEVLDFSLADLCFHGPDETLRLTANTQPAILTTSIALWSVFSQEAPQPDFVAGHSLGEYTALVVAGGLTFENAVMAVRTRGELMEKAYPAGKGGMAAVLGLSRDVLSRICERVSKETGTVGLANLNSPGQIVISGTAEGVQAAGAIAQEEGARRVIPLSVSGPFHSSLMRPASEQLDRVLGGMEVRKCDLPVVANVSASPVDDPTAVRSALVRQVSAPVLWEDSVRWMLEHDVDTFVEIGPGRVLSGLIRKIDRKANVYHVEDPESLKKTLQKLEMTSK